MVPNIRIKSGFSVALLLCLAVSPVLSPIEMNARRVKQSLKVTSASSSKNGKSDKTATSRKGETKNEGGYIKVTSDSCTLIRIGKDTTLRFDPTAVSFAGYEKQATAKKESFHIINNSAFNLHKVRVRIIYRDMKGRMLHSRDVTVACNVPHSETRKTDIQTWDSQGSFYYYLGNEPRRVATPYKVEIQPLLFWLSPQS